MWILDVNSRLCLSQSLPLLPLLPLLPRSLSFFLSFSLSLSRADFPGCVYANICLFHSDQVRCHCKKVARDALGQSGPSPADKWYHWLRLTCLWTVAGRFYGPFDFLQLGDAFIVPKYSAWSTGSLYILYWFVVPVACWECCQSIGLRGTSSFDVGISLENKPPSEKVTVEVCEGCCIVGFHDCAHHKQRNYWLVHHGATAGCHGSSSSERFLPHLWMVPQIQSGVPVDCMVTIAQNVAVSPLRYAIFIHFQYPAMQQFLWRQ